MENKYVVHLKVGADSPEVKEVTAPLGLDYLQEAVGGYIQTFYMHSGIVGWCNEEGKLNGLPENMLMIGKDPLSGTLMPYDMLVGDVLLL